MAVSSPPCPSCKKPLQWVAQYNQWWCAAEKKYHAPAQRPPQAAPVAGQPVAIPPAMAIWFLPHYRIRKKVLAIAQQYWVEDGGGRPLAYSRQKMFTLKEQIRVFSDESMAQELFRIQQTQILDVWGTFQVVDSQTNTIVGYVQRKALSSAFVRDAWKVMNPYKQVMGEIAESTGMGLARKFLPGGSLIPEQMTLTLGGVPVAQINQEFKIIGDIWDIHCANLAPQFDRRVLLGMALLMGMIERQRK